MSEERKTKLNLKTTDQLWKQFKSTVAKDTTMNQAVVALIEKKVKNNAD